MIQKGLLTTVVSDIALIVTAVALGQTISADIVVQTVIPIGAIIIAYLDAKYPETMDKIEEALGIVEKAQTIYSDAKEMAQESTKEAEVVPAQTVADEPVVEEEGV